jgi:hypothetical protein
MKTLLALAAALPIAATTSSAMAGGGLYSGNWPITVSHSNYANGTYCLTVTDDGSGGWPHSGGATLEIDGSTLYGSFQLIGHDFTVTITAPGGTGENAGLVYVANASNRKIGKGVYDEVNGGAELDSGVVDFGTKGGC